MRPVEYAIILSFYKCRTRGRGMRKWLRLCVIFSLVLTLGSSAAPAEETSLEAILRQSRDTWQAPGIAAAIVRGDETQFASVGVREKDHNEKVTPDTLFAIGSCTKAFTATALAILVA